MLKIKGGLNKVSVLSERGMVRAKELARELVRVDKERNYYKNAFEKVREVVSKLFNEIKQYASEIFDFIRNVFREGKEHYKYITPRKDYYNWYVPVDTTRLSQVRVPNVKLPRIRNLI